MNIKGRVLVPESLREIVIVTDAWSPQVNGVERTVKMLADELLRIGLKVTLITPEGLFTVPVPTYPEIRLAVTTQNHVSRLIEQANPSIVHIATEGPLGILARRHCIRRNRNYTTCYHTRYPEYISARVPVPLEWSYSFLRWFHGRSVVTMVSSDALKNELEVRGFRNLAVWSRGVQVEPFLQAKPINLMLPRPIFLNVGRVAVEKNLEAFLSLDLPGSKVVVGDGPAKVALEAKYPGAHFLGFRSGSELASIYASADVFVFPSRTDTYGLVMIEALAAGVPVAAFNVLGPRDVLGGAGCGVLSDDLRRAAMQALTIDRKRCQLFGAQKTMRESAKSFLSIIENALTMGVTRMQLNQPRGPECQKHRRNN